MATKASEEVCHFVSIGSVSWYTDTTFFYDIREIANNFQEKTEIFR